MFVSFQQKVFELGNFTGFKAFLPAGRTHKLKKTMEKGLLEIQSTPSKTDTFGTGSKCPS